jgi:hypothetical protein
MVFGGFVSTPVNNLTFERDDEALDLKITRHQQVSSHNENPAHGNNDLAIV